MIEVGLSAANDGSAGNVAKAGLHGLANGALPGVTEGFKNITENNKHQNWIDQTLNAVSTATQGVATGALVVAGGATVAAPVTGGTSLAVAGGSMVVAGVSGLANLGLGVVHDVTYVTGVSKQGGLITGMIGMAGQLADSKAAQRTTDWFMGNDAKMQQELTAKGIKHNYLVAADENKDGTLTAQEARDYLIKHSVSAEQVNGLDARALGDRMAASLPIMQRLDQLHVQGKEFIIVDNVPAQLEQHGFNKIMDKNGDGHTRMDEITATIRELKIDLSIIDSNHDGIASMREISQAINTALQNAKHQR